MFTSVQLPLTMPTGEQKAIRAMVKRTMAKPPARLTKSQFLARLKAFGRRMNPFSAGIRLPAAIHYAVAVGSLVAVLLVAFLFRTLG
jgi:hypothetical protein